MSTRSKIGWPVIASGALAAASFALLAAVWIGRERPDPTERVAPPRGGVLASGADSGASTIERILDTADALVRDGEADRAAAVLEAAVAEHPEDQELRLALGGALVLLERLPQAYAQYEAALAIGPRGAPIEFDAGVIASRLARLDRAEEHFSAAQAADPSDPRPPLFLAQVLVRQGRPQEARKHLLVATRLDETLALAWGSLAEISLQEGEAGVALQMIARARDLEPDTVAWRVIEARALKRSLRPAEALAALDPIRPPQRHDLPVLRLLGEIHGMLGQGAAAAAEFEAAALDRPDDGDLQFETAVWLERVGRGEDARRFAIRAAELGVPAGEEMARRLAQEPGG